MMNLEPRALGILCLALTGATLAAQTGPFDPESWPTTVNPTKTVHLVVTDTGLTPPGPTWLDGTLQILTGSDHVTADITIGGHQAKKVTGNHLNIADTEFAEWADDEFIDILVQVYGDAALFNAQGQPRDFAFLTGVLPQLSFPVGGQIPVEARNQRWNWVLFRIPNDLRPAGDSRYVGSIPPGAQGNTQYGGVNGGTLRMQEVPNLLVRVVAFGEQGAFGAPEDINKFFPPETCDPEPNTNLAGIDLAAGVTNHLVVLNDGDQTVTFQANVGPAGDLRPAVRPDGAFLNFGITDHYLGKPCNDAHAVKVCLDFYDDPAFAGSTVSFGPESYATDAQGGTATYPADQRQVLAGTGKWVRRSWIVPAVNLKGVSTGALTGGPRFTSENGAVFVSRCEIAVLRTGSHPLAGIDPLADCYQDPSICTDAYGNYVELDLAKDLRNGLDVGSSVGDQEMIVAEAGPAADRRQAVRPARDDGTPGATHQYLNFAILNEALGPSSQPPAHLALCVTYFDDPVLAGQRFKPEVYITERFGNSAFGFAPDSYFVTLTGSDKWLDAYWEIPDVKFTGVNQPPQAAARFLVGDKIFVSRVRYGVIRPCGPNAGANPLAAARPSVPLDLNLANASPGQAPTLRLGWPVAAAGFVLQATTSLIQPQWQVVTNAPVIEANTNVVNLPAEAATTFYRLYQGY